MAKNYDVFIATCFLRGCTLSQAVKMAKTLSAKLDHGQEVVVVRHESIVKVAEKADLNQRE